MDINQSVSMILQHGSDLEKARFRKIFYDDDPQPEVISNYLRLQNTDGGFPCAMIAGNPSAIHKTLTALWQLVELGLRDSNEVSNAISYLLHRQYPDGSWDEDASLIPYGLPPWISPGAMATRVYLSAYCAYRLALHGLQSHSAFQSALQFLLLHHEAGGKFDGFTHNTWIATSSFSLAGEHYADIVKSGLAYLSSLPSEDWIDSQIAWALDCLGASGISNSELFISKGLERLIANQDESGLWTSEDSEHVDISTTIEVLKVLKHYKVIA